MCRKAPFLLSLHADAACYNLEMFARPVSRLLAGLLAASAFSSHAAPPVDPPAYGLIVGYRAEVDTLQAANRDRGPWKANSPQVRDRWQEAVAQGRDRSQRVAKEAGVRVKDVGEAGSAALLRFEAPLRGQALADAMRRLRLHPDVAWVQPNVIERRAQALPTTPNDPLFAQQWHLQAPSVGYESGINLSSAWAATGGAASVIAVVDTGIRADHPDLAGRLLAGYDFVSEVHIANDGGGRDADPSDPGDWVTQADLSNPLFQECEVADSSWHGTFIAGQLAALTNNGLGVAGVNRNTGARVLPVRVAGKCGALVSDLLDGARWAAGLPVAGVPANPNPARVINLSFGGSAACSPDYQRMVDDVTNAGALLVVAAGNNAGPLTRPADCRGVMPVAAVAPNGAKAWYSSFGPQVALSAPGGSDVFGQPAMLLSTDNSGTQGPVAYDATGYYGRKQGTSFSAPLAAGVATLMLGINPSLTPADLIDRMKRAARPHVATAYAACSASNPATCACTTTTCGSGLLDAAASVQLASGPAAIIQRVGSSTPGATITLDGSASVAPTGQIVAYRWTQLSGPAVTIVGASQSVASVTLAAVDARYEFQLQVTDNTTPTALTGVDIVSVTAAYPPAAPSGGGGGGMGWAWGMALWAWVLALGWTRRSKA